MSQVTPDTQIGSDGVRYPTGTQPTVDPGFYGQGFDLADPDDNDVLTYNSATGKWEPSPSAGGGGGGADDINDLTDVTVTSVADNEVLAYDSGSSAWINQTPAEVGLLANVVEDTTPQLGGTLDSQGNAIINVGSIRHDVNTVAASGATETLVLGVNNVTMDENCEFTFPAATSGDYDTFTLLLSGAFIPTWPVSVSWFTGAEPIYATPTEYSFATYDGGTTWLGVASVVSRTYQLIRFTANGTFTKADYPWARTLKATIIGGGGGGGGAQATIAGQGSCGGGGAGGASAIAYFNLIDLGTEESVTVGGGGAGGVSGANGTTGGTSSFGTVDALGGGGGGWTAASTTFPTLALAGDAQGVTATGLPTVIVSMKGGGGSFGFVGGVSVAQAFGGAGGGTLLGSPTDDRRAGGEGPIGGSDYGGGGSGSANVPSTSFVAGGAGAGGVVVIELYA